jgi:hypothetical protein
VHATLFDDISRHTNALVKLTTDEDTKEVGFTIRSTYTGMTLLTNDLWRSKAGGLPLNSYLIATSLNANEFSSANEIDKRVILLRVADRFDLPTDPDTTRTLVDFYQRNPDTDDPSLSKMETFAKAQLQWSGVRLKVLGTFYMDADNKMLFGADLEDFFSAHQMRVYKPGKKALRTIVNFVDPKRKAKAETDAVELGMKKVPEPFQIGTVRFTSTAHMNSGGTDVPVEVFPGDFLARRTAVFGMTRTGKSNTTKTMVSAVALSALESRSAIGQLIFDINGEYSNANRIDKGSIADAFATNCVRFRASSKPKPGFRDIRMNFYDAGTLGVQIIAAGIREDGSKLSEDLQTFCGLELDIPETSMKMEGSDAAHFRRQLSIYQCILFASLYEPPAGQMVEIEIGTGTLDFLFDPLGCQLEAGDRNNMETRAAKSRSALGLGPGKGIQRVPIAQGVEFWKKIRKIEFDLKGYSDPDKGIRNKRKKPAKESEESDDAVETSDTVVGNGEHWLNDIESRLLSVMVGTSGKGGQIRSTGTIREAAKNFHSPTGSNDIGQDIYQLLSEGRIVILDLSVGSHKVRGQMADKIAREIFKRSNDLFTDEQNPPRIVLYVEEAHNLIGKKADLDETWPRIAKEGAKYGIALVYATQEPSSIHPNILANTENLFVTHLNNDSEIKTLSGYYDFEDFAQSLKTCPDVGFARVKTLSSPFVVPVQISEFKVDDTRRQFEDACRKASGWFKPLPAGN